MAASFGGLVAFLPGAHPEDVVGMVLIDTMFPDELRLDRFLPRDYRFVYYNRDDKCCTVGADLPVRPDQLATARHRQGAGDPGRLPRLRAGAAQPERLRVTRVRRPHPRRTKRPTSTGSLPESSWVDAPHFMEPVVPDVIADAVREVNDLAGGN